MGDLMICGDSHATATSLRMLVMLLEASSECDCQVDVAEALMEAVERDSIEACDETTDEICHLKSHLLTLGE
jgi:hypothetical protein